MPASRVIVLFLWSTLLLGVAQGYDFSDEIVIDTARNYVVASPLSITDSVHERVKGVASGKVDAATNMQEFFWYIFRSHSAQSQPGGDRIERYYGNNPLIHLRYLNALARSGASKAKERLVQESFSAHSIFREAAAMGMAELEDTAITAFCTSWLERETNAYVRMTLRALLQRRTQKPQAVQIPYLPAVYAGIAPTDSFFYNQTVTRRDARGFVAMDTELAPALPQTERIVAPHQQYSFPLKNAPAQGSFGNAHGGLFHVGTDSGWLLEGLPVHTIGPGRVRKIQHESTWGVLVAVEGILPSGKHYMAYYGHLDPNLWIHVGENVEAGQTIGKIGRSFTLDNGGYIAHLHLGIELRSFAEATLKGYDSDATAYRSLAGLQELLNP